MRTNEGLIAPSRASLGQDARLSLFSESLGGTPALLTIPTIFVTGAGSSTSYGFPLGAALVNQIVLATTRGNEALLRALHQAGYRERTVEEFGRSLEKSGLTSIDAFLEGAGDDAVGIGKIAIAHSIAEAEFQCVHKKRLFSPLDDHWLRYVWNLIRPGSSPDTLHQNAVTFITYNYDRTIEFYLRTAAESTYGLSSNAAADLIRRSIRIVHLHGQLAADEFGVPIDQRASPVRMAAGIKLIHDARATDDPDYQVLYELGASALYVVLLGFGYHQSNIQRLRLKDAARDNATIAGSTLGMGDAEVRVATGLIGRPMLTGAFPSERFLREVVQLR